MLLWTFIATIVVTDNELERWEKRKICEKTGWKAKTEISKTYSYALRGCLRIKTRRMRTSTVFLFQYHRLTPLPLGLRHKLTLIFLRLWVNCISLQQSVFQEKLALFRIYARHQKLIDTLLVSIFMFGWILIFKFTLDYFLRFDVCGNIYYKYSL